MPAIQELVQNHLVVIVLVLLAGIPFCYLYRQYMYPLLFHVTEGIIYASGFHIVLSGLVRGFAWFKTASSFDRETVEWTTPFFAPWQRSAYEPGWIFWVNVVAWILIAYIIIVIRPIGTKNKYHRNPEPGKKGPTGTKPRGSSYTYRSGRGAQQHSGSRRR